MQAYARKGENRGGDSTFFALWAQFRPMLVLPRTVRDDVLAHAREGHPEEVCGLLIGEHGEETSTVTRSRRTRNVADVPRVTYAIDPEEQLRIMEDVERGGEEVVGFYHSHPDGPDGPSRTDAAQATWEGYTYCIVSLSDADPLVGAWRWTGEKFEEESVRVE